MFCPQITITSYTKKLAEMQLLAEQLETLVKSNALNYYVEY